MTPPTHSTARSTARLLPGQRTARLATVGMEARLTSHPPRLGISGGECDARGAVWPVAGLSRERVALCRARAAGKRPVAGVAAGGSSLSEIWPYAARRARAHHCCPAMRRAAASERWRWATLIGHTCAIARSLPAAPAIAAAATAAAASANGSASAPASAPDLAVPRASR